MTLLNPTEIAQAQAILNKIPAGTYEISKIYGSAWSRVKSPTTFGAKFKKTVQAHLLRRIELNISTPKSNNHNIYDVH